MDRRLLIAVGVVLALLLAAWGITTAHVAASVEEPERSGSFLHIYTDSGSWSDEQGSHLVAKLMLSILRGEDQPELEVEPDVEDADLADGEKEAEEPENQEKPAEAPGQSKEPEARPRDEAPPAQDPAPIQPPERKPAPSKPAEPKPQEPQEPKPEEPQPEEPQQPDLTGKNVELVRASQLIADDFIVRYPYKGYVTKVLADLGDEVRIQFGSKTGTIPRSDVVETGKNPEPYRISWQFSSTSNATLQRTPDQSGYNVYAPVMYYVAASTSTRPDPVYVIRNYSNNINLARQQGYQTWLTYQYFGRSPNFSKKVMDDIIASALHLDVDGINIDFEAMGSENRAGFTKFITDLYKETQKHGLILSVDVVRPAQSIYSLCYDRRALAQNSDYLILMAYDQHWGSSQQEGSVASLAWTESSITALLNEGVPADKLILGVPFYTRNWTIRETTAILDRDMIRLDGIVNIRTQPNTSGGSSTVILTGSQNSMFEYLGTVQGESINGNSNWYRVDLNGDTAYITAAFSTLLPKGSENTTRRVSSIPLPLQASLDIRANLDSAKGTSRFRTSGGNTIHMTDVKINFDSQTQQTLVTYTDSEGWLNKIWLEDFDSLKRRRALADKYKLPGLAAWSLEWMDSGHRAWLEMK